MFEDFDEALAQDGKQRRRYCGFSRWVATLPEGAQAKARDLLTERKDDSTYKHNCRQLARYFQEKGANLNDQVLTRHRNKNCCGQKQGD